MKKNILFLGFALSILLFSSCNKWEDPEFVVPVYEGPAANRTIADIKAMHPSLGTGAQDSICSWDDTFIVKAVVVSSDQGGNCYKYITVMDETGGIEICIDRTGLYNDYPVGQTIYLDCRGLIVGDYYNKYQIGWEYNGSVGRINKNALDRYIYKDGMPDPEHTFVANPIEVTGSNQLSAENVNCLVKIDGCTFDTQYDGEPLANDNFTMDREVYINGATVIVRTSNYANFRSTVIDASKSYCLYGILSVYNSEYQLTLRTSEDIQFAYVPQEVTVASLSVDANAFTSGGWSIYPDNEAWKYQSFSGNDFIYHESSSSECDDWLITPAFQIDDLSDVSLYINHMNNVGGSPASYYQVYYSTSYDGGTFDENEWIAFNPNITNFPSAFDLSNAIDASVIDSPNFRIAFRYHKNGTANGTRWSIKELNFIRVE